MVELSDEANEQARAAHAEIVEALASPHVRLALPVTFTHGRGVQVFEGRRKVGPVLLRSEGQTLRDLLYLVGDLAEPVPPSDQMRRLER